MSSEANTYEFFRTKREPRKALRALGKLARNKEDTSQVFRITGYLDGPAMDELFYHFAKTENGKRILEERIDLRETLMNHEWLASLPEGSLGREYLDFCTAEGLTSDGLQVEMDRSGEVFHEAGEDKRHFLYRARHTHDFYHVLTGYGRDALGELCVLAFTSEAAKEASRKIGAEPKRYGLDMLCELGKLGVKFKVPDLPVFDCISEGRDLGRVADIRVEMDWEGMLEWPVSKVKERLNIGTPEVYLSIKDELSRRDGDYRKELEKLHAEKKEREQAVMAA